MKSDQYKPDIGGIDMAEPYDIEIEIPTKLKRTAELITLAREEIDKNLQPCRRNEIQTMELTKYKFRPGLLSLAYRVTLWKRADWEMTCPRLEG